MCSSLSFACFSLSRSAAAFSKSCALIAASFSSRISSISRLDVLHVRRTRHRADARARAGLVHHVDGLVGQETAGDVAVGKLRGGFERFVGELRLVVRLVLRAQALEDLDRLLDGRRLDLDRLEAALERGVLLDVLAVLVERGRADALQLAAGQRGLDDVGGVHRAFGRAGADDGVQLVDEEDDVLRARESRPSRP